MKKNPLILTALFFSPLLGATSHTVHNLFEVSSKIQSEMSYKMSMLFQGQSTPTGFGDLPIALSLPEEFERMTAPLLAGLHKIVQVQKEKLSTFERYLLKQINGEKDAFTGQGVEPFLYAMGNGKEEKKEAFTLMTMNLCFLPGDMPIHYGGVPVWENRLEKVVECIEKTDADVVCLQEAFVFEAVEKLYNALKYKYPHFFLHIAPKVLSKNALNSFGFGSGLLVMSRLPVSNAVYHPITPENLFVHRGVFTFDVARGNEPPVRIGTTHLVAFAEEGSRQVRLQQMQEIIDIMKTSPHPTLLCGDFNIDLGKGEPAEALLRSHFDQTYATVPTYVDYTSYWKDPEAFVPEYQILDYILPLKNDTPLKCKVAVVDAWGQIPPIDAASDHRALTAMIE